MYIYIYIILIIVIVVLAKNSIKQLVFVIEMKFILRVVESDFYTTHIIKMQVTCRGPAMVQAVKH